MSKELQEPTGLLSFSPSTPNTTRSAQHPLKLVLDQPNRLFAPRDILTGRLEGWDTLDGSRIFVVLEGRCKAQIRTKHRSHELRRRDQCLLLYRIHRLKFDPRSKGPAHFAVEIPENVETDFTRLDALLKRGGHWTRRWAPHEKFECESGHPVPPSMVMPSSDTYIGAQACVGRGYTQYKLTAVQSELGDDGTGSLRVTHQVPFYLTSKRISQQEFLELEKARRQKLERTCIVLSVHLDPDVQMRGLSLSEKIKDKLSSTSVPRFHFSTTMETSRVAAVGRCLNVNVQLRPAPLPEGYYPTFPNPDVTLESMEMKLKSRHRVRVVDSGLSEHEIHNLKGPSTKLKVPPPMNFRGGGANYGNQSYCVAVDLPRSVLPSHKTFIFCREYELQCKLLFRCANKDVRTQALFPLTIISEPRLDGHDIVDSGIPCGYDLRTNRVEDELKSVEMAKEMLRARH